ncbi:hypothetical protein ACHAXS_011332, partial [Conticribra weissflogii]
QIIFYHYNNKHESTIYTYSLTSIELSTNQRSSSSSSSSSSSAMKPISSLRLLRTSCSLSRPAPSFSSLTSSRPPSSCSYRSSRSSSSSTSNLLHGPPAATKSIDTLIIGGGPVGLSTAYHLAVQRRSRSRHESDGSHSPSIAVVERDPTYAHSSATLSAGGVRQQFSAGENIQMSLYGRDFLRDAARLLSVHRGDHDDVVDVQFQEHGYLFLSSSLEGKRQMERNHRLQKSLGCHDHVLLTPLQLKERFPWLNVEDILLGSFGAKGEGWFDPWALIRGLRAKCLDLGVEIVDGGFPVSAVRNCDVGSGGNGRILSVDVVQQQQQQKKKKRQLQQTQQPKQTEQTQQQNQEIVRYNVQNVVNAAGAHCQHLLNTLTDNDTAIHPIPVEPRKRCVFFFHCATHQQDPSAIVPHVAPLTVCPVSNAYFRSEGIVTDPSSGQLPTGNFLCGVSPSRENDGAVDDLDELDFVDHHLWEDVLWPALYHRVPAFGEVKVKSSWAGLYECESNHTEVSMSVYILCIMILSNNSDLIQLETQKTYTQPIRSFF